MYAYIQILIRIIPAYNTLTLDVSTCRLEHRVISRISRGSPSGVGQFRGRPLAIDTTWRHQSTVQRDAAAVFQDDLLVPHAHPAGRCP